MMHIFILLTLVASVAINDETTTVVNVIKYRVAPLGSKLSDTDKKIISTLWNVPVDDIKFIRDKADKKVNALLKSLTGSIKGIRHVSASDIYDKMLTFSYIEISEESDDE